MQINSLDSIRNDIVNNNLLTKEEEVTLSEKIIEGDTIARDKLISSNYRLAVSMAKKYYRNGINFDDLLQESFIGLVKAVDRFDHTRGFKFSTYACWWIKQACLQYINEHTTVMKVPTHSRLLSSKIKKFIAEFEERFGQKPSDEEISESFGVTIDAVKNSAKSDTQYLSIDKNEDDDGENKRSLLDKIDSVSVSPEVSYENKQLLTIIKKHLRSLSPREEIVIRLRFGIQEDIYNTNDFPRYKD